MLDPPERHDRAHPDQQAVADLELVLALAIAPGRGSGAAAAGSARPSRASSDHGAGRAAGRQRRRRAAARGRARRAPRGPARGRDQADPDPQHRDLVRDRAASSPLHLVRSRSVRLHALASRFRSAVVTFLREEGKRARQNGDPECRQTSVRPRAAARRGRGRSSLLVVLAYRCVGAGRRPPQPARQRLQPGRFRPARAPAARRALCRHRSRGGRCDARLAQVRPDDYVDRPRLGRRPHPDRRRAQPRRPRPRRRHRSGADPRGRTPMPAPPASPAASPSAARICSRRRSARPTCSPSISPRRSTCACARASSPQMRPGTRVVSHDFDMGDWRCDQRRRIGTANVYLWIVPARVAGSWTLTADGRTVAARPRAALSALHRHAPARRRPDRAGPARPATASASSPISAAAGASSRAGSTGDRSRRPARCRLARRPRRLMPLALASLGARRSPGRRCCCSAAMEFDRGLLALLLCRRRPGAGRGGALVVTELGGCRGAARASPRRRSCCLLVRRDWRRAVAAARHHACPAGLLVELQKGWIGAAAPRRPGASRRRRNPTPSRAAMPPMRRWSGSPRPAAPARPRAAAALAVGRGLAGARGRAQPADARRPLAERRRRRLGVRPVLDPAAAVRLSARRSGGRTSAPSEAPPTDCSPASATTRRARGRSPPPRRRPPRGRAAPHSGSRALRLSSNASLLGAVSTPAWR